MTFERIVEAKIRKIDEALKELTEKEKVIVVETYLATHSKIRESETEKILRKARAAKGKQLKTIGYLIYGLAKTFEAAAEDLEME